MLPMVPICKSRGEVVKHLEQAEMGLNPLTQSRGSLQGSVSSLKEEEMEPEASGPLWLGGRDIGQDEIV